MLSFRDVLVTPYTDLLQAGHSHLAHRGGPLWPDFDSQYEARHRRRDVVVDDEPEPQLQEEYLKGTWAWAGPITAHFGHQILEFSMRLAPTLAHDPDARFLFGVTSFARFQTIDNAPPFFKAILDWLGIPLRRCRVVSAPTLVETLVVAPQAEQLGGPGPTAEHLDLMDDITRARFEHLDSRGTVYVSRATMVERFAGEATLEAALERTGIEVVRPEALPLVEQLQIYSSARLLIFAEGSAMYGPLLTGRSLHDVAVLCRRPQSRLAFPQIGPRAKSIRYFEAIKELKSGTLFPRKPVSMTLLDEDAVLDVFDQLDVPLRRHWDARNFAERCQEDIASFPRAI